MRMPASEPNESDESGGTPAVRPFSERQRWPAAPMSPKPAMSLARLGSSALAVDYDRTLKRIASFATAGARVNQSAAIKTAGLNARRAAPAGAAAARSA